MKKLIVLFILITLSWSVYAHEQKIPLNPHYDNYIYYLSNYDSADAGIEGYNEVKYQISIEVNLLEVKDYGLFFAYTQRSWWDLYNVQNSRPFRETNYNPQVFIRTPKFGLFQFDVGYWHESNGGTPAVSRSWDRWYLEGSWIDDLFNARFKGWNYFLSEDPLMAETAGNYELELTLKVKEFIILKDVYLTVVQTNAYEEIIVSHPVVLFNNLYSVYSYRSGKYDSQIDWDKEIQRFSVGIQLTRR